MIEAVDANLEQRSVRCIPRTMELIGPAGSGKSTLLKELTARQERLVPDAATSRWRSLPFAVRHAARFLPVYLLKYRHSRWFTRRETRSMAYLDVWHRDLTRRKRESTTVTLWERGPVFRLVLLRAFGPEVTHSPTYDRWFQATIDRWAGALDVVIQLDAPDAVLDGRIRSREAWHRVKHEPPEVVLGFLRRYRTAYEEVVASLTARGNLRVLRFDTSRYSTERIADEILPLLTDRATQPNGSGAGHGGPRIGHSADAGRPHRVDRGGPAGRRPDRGSV